ncbi:MAG: glycosyltransferase family 39 protein [Chloroflexota bacterium]
MRSRRLVLAAVILTTALGLGLRLFALDHGLPYQYVPDESTMVGSALRMGASRSIQPSTFIYPALLMYLFAAEYLGLLVVGRLTGLFASVAHFREFAFTDPTLFYLLPRLAIALVGTATIPLAYLLGKRLYGRWAGVAAAVLVATSVMHVQMSHQARHWVPVSFLTLVVLWVSLDLAQWGRRRDYWLSGLLVGLTAATSFNGFLLMLLPLVAHWQQLRKRGLRIRDPRAHGPMLVALLLAPVVFFALNPYILLQFDRFVAFHSGGEASIGGQIRGHYENYLQQFLEKQGFTFFAEATLAYEPAITLLGIVGAFLAARRFRSTAPLILSYPLFHYIMFATTSPSLEQRYMLPAVIMWALPAGLATAGMAGWLHSRLGGMLSANLAVGTLAILSVALVSLPSLRYDWLLSQTDTRTLAKGWIEGTIPAGADIAVESYPPPLSPDLDSLKAQQQAEPRSLGARDQWLLEKGLPEGDIAYQLIRLSLVDNSPNVDRLSPYLAAHQIRYFVVSDFRWKSDHQGHLALKSYLARNGRLLRSIPPGKDERYSPSDMLNNMEDPLVELWKVDRPGPTIEVYEVTR